MKKKLGVLNLESRSAKIWCCTMWHDHCSSCPPYGAGANDAGAGANDRQQGVEVESNTSSAMPSSAAALEAEKRKGDKRRCAFGPTANQLAYTLTQRMAQRGDDISKITRKAVADELYTLFGDSVKARKVYDLLRSMGESVDERFINYVLQACHVSPSPLYCAPHALPMVSPPGYHTVSLLPPPLLYPRRFQRSFCTHRNWLWRTGSIPI